MVFRLALAVLILWTYSRPSFASSLAASRQSRVPVGVEIVEGKAHIVYGEGELEAVLARGVSVRTVLDGGEILNGVPLWHESIPQYIEVLADGTYLLHQIEVRSAFGPGVSTLEDIDAVMKTRLEHFQFPVERAVYRQTTTVAVVPCGQAANLLLDKREVPVRVDIVDGSPVLIVEERQDQGRIVEDLPSQIPVRTKTAKAEWMDGIAPWITMRPACLRVRADGVWDFEFTYTSAPQHLAGMTEEEIIAWHARNGLPLKAPERTYSLPVMAPGSTPDSVDGVSLRGGWDFAFIDSTEFPPFGTVPAAAYSEVKNRVREILLRFMDENAGVIRFEIQWIPQFTGYPASTEPRRNSTTYPIFRNTLFDLASNEPFPEQDYYDNLPPGSNLPVYAPGGAADTAQFVQVPIAIWHAIGEHDISGEPAAVISVYQTASPLDFDPRDGIDQGALDFTHILLHESLHALGFYSSTAFYDASINNITDVTPFDLFVYRSTDIGSSLMSSEVSGERRDLASGSDSVCATATGSNEIYPVDDTPGDSKSHFRAAIADPINDYVGVMTKDVLDLPSSFSEGDLSVPQGSDLDVLDMTGLMIDANFVFDVPARPLPVLPGDGTVLATLTPTLQWTSGSDTDVVDVYIFETGTRLGSLVYEQRDIPTSTTSLAVPGGVLEGSTEYTWFVTAVNELTVSRSEPFDFTTPADCPADCDGSGTLNLDDIQCFTDGFLNQTPEGDCDGNGSWNLDDIQCFTDAFLAGCP